MSLWKIARVTYRVAQLESATRHPGRYVKNRAKSKAMSGLGFWRLWRRWWRA